MSRYCSQIRSAFFVLFICIFCINTETWSQNKKRKNTEVNKEELLTAEAEFTSGMKEYELERYSDALKYFERARRINPDAAGIYYMMANVYVKQNNLYNAIPFAQKAIALDPNNKYYYLLLAQIYERKQDFNEAAKTYQQLIKKLPQATEYLNDLAIQYIYLNKWEEAIKTFDKIEKIYGISEDITRHKQQIYLKINKLDEAILQAKRLWEAYPDEIRYMVNLIELLVSHDKLTEAERYVKMLLDKDAQNPFGLLAASDIYKAKGDEAKSQAMLEMAFKSPELNIDTKVGILISKIRMLPEETIKKQCLSLGAILIEVHPTESKAYGMYGDILTLAGDTKSALPIYLQALRLDNTHFKIWQQVVLIEHEQNMLDSLLLHTEKALENFPNSNVFWFYNGLAHQLKGNYKKAVAAFEQGKKLTQNDKGLLVQFNSLLGDSYNGLKEFKKSDEAFEEALKYDQDNHIVLNNYSYYLSLRKDKLEYAKKMSERVIKEFPDNATYLDTYAWILYVMKEYQKAKEIFEKIIDKTSNGTIIEHYGDVLFQLGQKDKAIEIWIKAKEMGDTSEIIDKKIRDKKLYE